MKAPHPESTTRDDGTWLEPEELTYPHGGFSRRAYVVLAKNEYNPIELPYGEKRVVKTSIPDTFFSIPAKLKHKGRTIAGFVSSNDDGFTFTPEAQKTGTK